jgi:hypothetical protein
VERRLIAFVTTFIWDPLLHLEMGSGGQKGGG